MNAASKDVFRRTYGTDPFLSAHASGRVNLIGEHTDYNNGFVLPTALPQQTRVLLTKRWDWTARAISLNKPGEVLKYTVGEERAREHWGDYLQGATALLQKKGFRVSGFDAVVESDVPIGSGLSSSAALGVAFLRGLRSLWDLPLTDLDLAQLVQRIENEFVGAHVGIMDPMAAALAEPGYALFLDTQTLQYERVLIPFRECELFVIHSGISHRNTAGGYNQRRRECEEAAAKLGVVSLRQVSLDALSKLPEGSVWLRRARHVITENQRVLDAVQALRNARPIEIGRLFLESHQSMRDDYEVSTPEIDALVQIGMETVGVMGLRLTGGGFGGSIVGLAERGCADVAVARIVRGYEAATGLKAQVILPLSKTL